MKIKIKQLKKIKNNIQQTMDNSVEVFENRTPHFQLGRKGRARKENNETLNKAIRELDSAIDYLKEFLS